VVVKVQLYGTAESVLTKTLSLTKITLSVEELAAAVTV
jgi:hypothetical protein